MAVVTSQCSRPFLATARGQSPEDSKPPRSQHRVRRRHHGGSRIQMLHAHGCGETDLSPMPVLLSKQSKFKSCVALLRLDDAVPGLSIYALATASPTRFTGMPRGQRQCQRRAGLTCISSARNPTGIAFGTTRAHFVSSQPC